MYIQKLTVLLLVNQFLNGLAQYRTSIKYDEPSYDMDLYVDSEIDMKSTYRSPIEKFLQGLMTTLRTQQSTGIAERIIYSLPDPLKSLFVGNQDGDGGRSFGDVLNAFQDDFQAIFPGTLWCGRGNAAVSGDAVGIFAQSDMCCRQHDNCPYSIEAGRNFGLLKNNGIFTRSACTCDYEFFKCLKKVNTLISSNIGATYFNILRPQCFGYHYPIESCEKYDSVRRVDKKCLEYNVNYSRNKTMEWYDLPDF